MLWRLGRTEIVTPAPFSDLPGYDRILTVIGGRSLLALDDIPAANPIRGNLELIQQTVERAAALTRQLLAFSRKQLLQPKALDLNGVVAGIVPLLRRLIGEDIELTIGPGAISVAITVGANTAHNYGVHFSIILAGLLALGVVAATILLCYRCADWLCRILGQTGTTILIRLSSFLLVCIGVQIIWNGAEALLGSIHFQVS